MWFRTMFLGGLAFLLVLQGGTARSLEPSYYDVFTSGRDGYHTYRIPAIIETAGGTLLAFCEGRKSSRSDHGDVDLVMKRSTDGGRSWSEMQLVHEEGGDERITIGNPCPVLDKSTGTVWLTLCRDNNQLLVLSSTDDGASWSKPRDITATTKGKDWGWVATGPGVGIQLERGDHKGRLVIPCDHSIQLDDKRVMRSHIMFSDDHGETWKLGGTLDLHTDECQVVELLDGRLMINMRNYWGRAGGRAERDRMRAVATSSDGGATWSELSFDKTLIEPICQASFLRLPASSKDAPAGLLFSNPASRQERSRLSVRFSPDEGRSWPVSQLLHEGPSAYSCLVVASDGVIGCIYEGGDKGAYEKIIFTRFDRQWLLGQ